VSGGPVATVFALGLIEAGAVAILTISASTGYAAAECAGVTRSLNHSPRRARLFYAANLATAAAAGAVILIPGAPLLAIALNANVLATVLAPVTLIFVVMLANDPRVAGPVGEQTLHQHHRDRRHRVHRGLRGGLRYRQLPASGEPTAQQLSAHPHRNAR